MAEDIEYGRNGGEHSRAEGTLDRYMRQVKAGGTVVITERGKPIARIVPMRPSREERVQDLVEAGLVSWGGQRLDPLAPVTETKGGFSNPARL